MTKPAPKSETPEAPAIVRDHHAQIQPISNVAGAEKGWRKLSMVELAYRKEKFGPMDSSLARSRRDAGLAYAKIFDMAQSSGTDSTQALNGSRGAGSGIPFGIAQSEAMKQLGVIAGMMGARDSIIVRKFCGEDMSPSEAVRLAGCDDETRVYGKIRDVMDDLMAALEHLRPAKMRVGTTG